MPPHEERNQFQFAEVPRLPPCADNETGAPGQVMGFPETEVAAREGLFKFKNTLPQLEYVVPISCLAK